MVSFKKMLLENSKVYIPRHLDSKKEIRDAISKWSYIPQAERYRVANIILRSAEEVGYIVRHPEILSFADTQTHKKVTSRVGKTRLTLGDLSRSTQDDEFVVNSREEVVDTKTGKLVGKYNEDKEEITYKRGSSLEKWLRNNSF